MLDLFENQFVDMDTIVKKNIAEKGLDEEPSSPFASPKKRRMGSLSKDEYKQKRREEKRREMEDYERREREAPKQYSLVKIKTSCGHYPVMNYISQFTAEEIHEAKKCMLNLLRRPLGYQGSPNASPEKKRGRTGGFSLSVHATNEGEKKEEPAHEEEKKELIEPKTRAPGGVWVAASDIPFSFQNFIVYHNVSKMAHVTNFADKWTDATQPYIPNEKDVIIKLELDEEAMKTQMAEYSNLQHAH